MVFQKNFDANNIMSRKWSMWGYWVQPILIGFYALLFTLVHNIQYLSFYDFTFILSGGVLFSVLVTLFFTTIFRSHYKGCLAATFFILIFFNLRVFMEYTPVWLRLRYVVFLLGVILIILCIRLVRSSKQTSFLATFLIFPFGALIIFSFWEASQHLIYASQSYNFHDDLMHIDFDDLVCKKVQHKPNIFYIILDRYPGLQTLQEFFGEGNEQFLTALKNCGFYVPKQSYSNYPWTSFSLASSLNMKYLPQIESLTSDVSQRVLSQWWKNNNVFKYLKHHGYSIFCFNGNFSNTAEYVVYSKNNQKTFGNILYAVLDKTILGYVLPINRWNVDAIRAEIDYQLHSIADFAQWPTPFFAYVHIMCPHNPIVFDREGKDYYPGRPLSTFSLAKQKRLYRDQVEAISYKILKVVKKILKESTSKPVIILQGDHGVDDVIVQFLGKRYKDSQVLPYKACHYAFNILNAYYMPGVETHVLEKYDSPVNNFRILFNYYFGANFTLLKNRSYVLPTRTLSQVVSVDLK